MIACELAGRPELGEDPDHHPAQQIDPLGIARGGDLLLEELERSLVSPSSQAAIAAAAGSSAPSSIRARIADASKSSSNGASTARGAVGIVPGDQQPGELDRRLALSRVELERPPQRGLVVGAGEHVGLGGRERVEEGLDLGRRDRPGELRRSPRRR